MLWTKECGAMSTSRSHKSLTRRNIFGKPTQSHRYIQHNVARLLLLSSSGCPDRFQLKEFRAPGALANCKLRSDFYHKNIQKHHCSLVFFQKHLQTSSGCRTQEQLNENGKIMKHTLQTQSLAKSQNFQISGFFLLHYFYLFLEKRDFGLNNNLIRS